jgi:hypothetical protein
VLAACLAFASPLLALEPVALVTAPSQTLPYASIGQSVMVTAGVDGMPEMVEIGMIITLVDPSDPDLTFIGEVTGPLVENNEPTGGWVVRLIE